LLVRSSNYRTGTDNVNGYYFGIERDGSTSYLTIGRMDQGWTALQRTSLGSSTAFPLTNTKRRLAVVMTGPRMQFYIDGTLRATIYDATYLSGSVGFRTYTAAGSVDNLVVSSAPRYANQFSATTSGSDAAIANFTDHAAATGNVWSISGNRLAASGAGAALVGNYGWSDYEFTASVRPTSSAAVAGLIVRGHLNAGAQNGYAAVLNRSDDAAGKLQLLRVTKGAATVLAEADFTFAEGTATDYPLIVRAVNNTIRVYANTDGSTGTPSTARPLITVVDNVYPTGMAGVVSLSGTADFDDLNVKDKFVWQEEFNDGTLSGWKEYGSGTATVSDNELTLVQNNNGYKITDGYATWENYTIKADIKLLIKSGKSNGGFTYLSTDFGAGQDDLRGYVTGVNYNPSTTPLANEHTGVETGAIHWGWTALTNTTAGQVAFDPNEWHPMEITVTSTGSAATTIRATVDGKLCYSYTAPANRDFHYGQIAARVFNSDMKVRNLRVIPSGAAEPAVEFSIAGRVRPGGSGTADMSGLTVARYAFADTELSTPLGTAVVSADGSYVFGEKAPGGKYVVRAVDPSGIFEASTALVDLVKDVSDADIALGAAGDLILTKEPDGPLSAKVVLDTAAGDDADASILIAFYDADGRLVRVERATEATVVNGTFKRLDIAVSDVPETAVAAKAFVWGGQYAPLRLPEEATL
ncbi:MAG: DUF1080 domain-containing protein, partial [Oscillospiraceae bacterium]|nr:DUF1080 domain-containing protein [Oscillospiraceae bacterium]